MQPLRTLVKAGIRHEKGTFVGLAILLFLAALALTFTINLFVDLSEREDVLLNEAGPEPGEVYVRPACKTPRFRWPPLSAAPCSCWRFAFASS